MTASVVEGEAGTGSGTRQGQPSTLVVGKVVVEGRATTSGARMRSWPLAAARAWSRFNYRWAMCPSGPPSATWASSRTGPTPPATTWDYGSARDRPKRPSATFRCRSFHAEKANRPPLGRTAASVSTANGSLPQARPHGTRRRPVISTLKVPVLSIVGSGCPETFLRLWPAIPAADGIPRGYRSRERCQIRRKAVVTQPINAVTTSRLGKKNRAWSAR